MLWAMFMESRKLLSESETFMWKYLRNWCDNCQKEMKPIHVAYCKEKEGKREGAVCQCEKCKNKAFSWASHVRKTC